MHVGVFIGVFQARQADQGIGVTQHRGGDFFHQLHHLTGINGLAHAHFAKHGHHRSLGASAEFVGALHFFVHGHTLEHGRGGHSVQAGLHFGGDLLFALGGQA